MIDLGGIKKPTAYTGIVIEPSDRQYRATFLAFTIVVNSYDCGLSSVEPQA